MTNLTLTFPLIYLALWAMAMLMLGAFTRNARLVGALTCFGLLMLLVPMLTQPALGAAFATEQGPLLHMTPLTNTMQALLLVLAAMVSLMFEPYYTPRKAYRPELYVLLILSVAGMFVLMNAADLLSLYVGLELMSFPLYILAATLRDNARSSESALKYFVLGGMVSALVLFGMSLVFAATGLTQLDALAVVVANQGMQNPLLLVGLLLVLLGLLFKLSAVPFHMWTPDVYEGAPTPITALMAALPKVAVLVLLVRVLDGPMATLQALWQPALAVVAVLSMCGGALVAILQTNLKRLMAWSTIANVGFVLCGLVAASAVGQGASLFYLVVYGLTTLGLFAALTDLKSPQHGQLGFIPPSKTVDDLRGLAKVRPYLAITMLVFLFSLAGVPPFGGFMAKLMVFGAAVQAGYAWLAVVGVLASAVAVFYSLWLVKVMYFEEPFEVSSIAKTHTDVGQSPAVVIMALALLAVVGLGLFPNLLADVLMFVTR